MIDYRRISGLHSKHMMSHWPNLAVLDYDVTAFLEHQVSVNWRFFLDRNIGRLCNIICRKRSQPARVIPKPYSQLRQDDDTGNHPQSTAHIYRMM